MVTVELSWTDESNKEDGFRVYRSTVAGASFSNDYTEIDSISPNTTTYSDTSPPEVADVSYAVTAFDSVGESAPATSGTLDLRPQTLESIISDSESIIVSTSRSRVINDVSSADTESIAASISNVREVGSSLVDSESIVTDVSNIRKLGSSPTDTESIASGQLEERIKSAYTDGDYEALSSIVAAVDADLTIVAGAEQRLVVQID